jgi:hypothetical protein
VAESRNFILKSSETPRFKFRAVVSLTGETPPHAACFTIARMATRPDEPTDRPDEPTDRTIVRAGLRPSRAKSSDLPILKSVFPVDPGAIGVGVQPALGLGEVQIEGPRLAIGCQQFPDVVHLLARLLSRFESLKRNQCRRQRFRDDPFVVAGDSLFWHDGRILCQGDGSNSRLAL